MILYYIEPFSHSIYVYLDLSDYLLLSRSMQVFQFYLYLILSLGIPGYLCLNMPISDNLWQFLAVSGNLGQTRAISGNIWQSLAISGNLWAISIEYQISGCQQKQERASYCYQKLVGYSFFFPGQDIEKLALLKLETVLSFAKVEVPTPLLQGLVISGFSLAFFEASGPFYMQSLANSQI